MVALLNGVRGLDWSDVYDTTDVNDQLNFFSSSILMLFDNHVGLRRLRSRNRINPWFNMTIQRYIGHAVWEARELMRTEIVLDE
jgi:hypothetical protein